MIPFVISPYGMFGSPTSRFLFGIKPLPLPKHNKEHEKAWPNAERYILDDVPSDILPRANDLRRITRPGEYFDNTSQLTL